MKILWVSEVHPNPDSGAGGTEMLMVQQLRQLGHQVDTIWADDLPRRISHGNLHYAFELPRTYSQAIRSACQRRKFDVVTVNLGQSYLACEHLRREGFAGAFIVRSHGLDDHLNETLTYWSKQLKLPHRGLVKSAVSSVLTKITDSHIDKAAQRCDGYMVSSSLDANFLSSRHGLSADLIATISQAPADTFFATPAIDLNVGRLSRLLYVAGYHFAKGPHAVAAAARTLLTGNDQLTLTWICHPDDHLTVIHLLGDLADRVRLLGWMPQEELVREFDEHGIFLYPSLFDGFGKIFLEAMSRGLCVIGTKAGGMADILQDRVNGFVCEYNSPEQIVAATEYLQQDQNAAQQMSRLAVETARAHTWRRVGREVAEFFKQRLASKANTSKTVITSK